MQEIEVTLSEWVFNAINAREVLTLHRNYFRLRKPLERRLYEIARKHCGFQTEWKVGVQKLKAKTGSNSTDKEFRRLLSNIVDEDAAHAHIPDYSISLEGDMVTFRNRSTMTLVRSVEPWSGRLDPEAYIDARSVAPGWDVYMLEHEWRSWLGENEIEPKAPARHYVKFCQSWYEKRGQP